MIIRGFNSKLVRLKVRRLALLRRSGVMFQFQTGAIKSGSRGYPRSQPRIRFNSKLVRLKVGIVNAPTLSDFVFQFQTGAIKRNVKPAALVYIDDRFNSKLVRLKAVQLTR